LPCTGVSRRQRDHTFADGSDDTGTRRLRLPIDSTARTHMPHAACRAVAEAMGRYLATATRTLLLKKCHKTETDLG
jgi:hypothetical protein